MYRYTQDQVGEEVPSPIGWLGFVPNMKRNAYLGFHSSNKRIEFSLFTSERGDFVIPNQFLYCL